MPCRKVRKAKPDAQERGDEGKLQRTKSNDPSHPVFNEQQKSTNGAKPAGFDSSAVEDHMSTDEISLHQASAKLLKMLSGRWHFGTSLSKACST